MSKRVIRVLSMVLTLVMMLSLSTPAFAWGGIDTGSGWDRQIDEDDFREIEPAEEVEEEEVYDYFQTDGEDGYQVTVEAPMGSLPMLAELRAERVEIDDVREAVMSVCGEEPEILLALDISFWMNGIEIEPEEEVRVKVTAEELEDVANLRVIHIPDDADVDPESLDLVDEENLSFALGTNEVAFATDSFSTFVITGQQNRRVTVHYGYMTGNTFTEFTAASTSTSFPGSLNTSSYGRNNPYAYLIYDFEGYRYKETRRDRENGSTIDPVLQMYNDYQNDYNSYRVPRYTSNGGSSWTSFSNVNNLQVYVIYEPLTVTQGASGDGSQGGSQTDKPDLPASKNVEPNGDGTYNITLSVTGAEGKQTEVKKASVIVILDLSGSMNYNMAGDREYSGRADSINSNARLSIAAKAVNALADKLLTKMGGPNQDQPLVQMALITFSDTADVKQFSGSPYTSNLTSYKNTVNALTAVGGTNWEAALIEANALEVSTDTPTYVVFVSDGDPTYRVSRMNDNDATITSTAQTSSDYFYWELLSDGVFGSGRAFRQAHYDAAKRTAQSIVSHNKSFYTIGVSSQGSRMENLATDAYNGNVPAGEEHYFPGNSTTELTDAFDAIASYVEQGLGFTEVTIDDGVTEMTTVETDALTGTPENFVYRKGDNQVNPESNPEWTGEGVPQAEITDDNHVIWDTSAIGKLEPGVTYSVTFTVWPSQQSYDIIADINNGIIRDASGNIVRTGTPAEAYNAQPDSVKEQIGIVGGQYTLKTNTGVNLTYKYNGQTGSNSVTVKKEGSMPLDTTYFSMTKDWKNQLPQDSRTAQVLTKEDTDGKKYLVNSKDEWILDDAGNKIEYGKDFDSWDKAVYFVDLIVTKKGADYTEVRLTSEDQTADGGNGPWEWNQMFVAPGVLTYDKSLTKGAFTLRETGDDYTVKEKPSEYYYWELYAETYHPMVINGEACVLQLVTNESEVPSDVKGAENANKFNGDYFNIGGVVYKKLGSADDATISAVNERRSYLNLTKVVNGDNAPADTYFTYTVKMENPNGLYEGGNGYSVDNDDFWFSIYDPVNKVTVKDSSLVTGATAEEGNTGYWHFANVKGGKTITIKIKAGWNVRFTNLFTGTTYEFEEPIQEMDDGFIFNKVEASAVKDGTALENYNPTIADTKINGEITQPNTDFTVTYTNDYAGFFYVYHSADKTIERYPMAENGKEIYVDGKTFDIAHQTKEGSLYGGYYKDYKNKGISDEEILELTSFPYTDDKGTAYAGATDVWEMKNAYDVSGLTMVPVVNTVYYLKEVPETKYLRPYLHYTYKLTNNEITASWLISDVDDANYLKTGFIVTNDADKEDPAKVVASLKVTNTNNGNYIKLTPTIVFDADGYLTYVEVMRNSAALTEETGFQAGCKVQEFWVTPDGLFVTGITLRTYGVINDHDDINNAATDDEVSSSITVYTAP